MPINPATGKKMTLYEMIEERGFIVLDSMEGVADFAPPTPIVGSKWSIAPGILLATAITAGAYFIHQAPIPPFTLTDAPIEHPIGTSLLAILIGILIASVTRLPRSILKGCRWTAAWLIPIAIVFLGARMDFGLIATAGPLLVATVAGLMLTAIALSLFLGKCFGLSPSSSYLLGVGTAVCGSSAILAVAPVSKAKEDEIVLSIGAVNLIGLIAMFGCVATFFFLPEMSATLYGAWSGATIHAVPQVAAAGESHSEQATSIAMMVKLLRVSLLAPVVMLTALWISSKSRKQSTAVTKSGSKPKPFWKYIPWFVWAFAIVATISSLQLLPNLQFERDNTVSVLNSKDYLSLASKYLLAISMAAIGLQVNVRSMIKSGIKILSCGLLVWLILAAAALFMLQLIFSN